MDEAVSAEDLKPCKICGRTFLPNALKKHAPICQKSVIKKRRVFDSSRQRAEGTDISTVKPIKQKSEPPKKQSNWRRKHQEFISTIRAAKGLDQILKEGGELPPPPPPSYDPDYVQCPFCQRRFNENAADRHISFCKEQAARITNKAKLGGDTKGKPVPRTQFKPPSIKKTNSPASLTATNSRLPQPPNLGKPASGILSGKPAVSATVTGNRLQTFSPAHRNSAISSPQTGMDLGLYEAGLQSLTDDFPTTSDGSLFQASTAHKVGTVGPPLRTGRDLQRLHESDTKTGSSMPRSNELLPMNKGSLKSKTPPSMARNPTSVPPTNKRKTYNTENYSRPDDKMGYDTGDHSDAMNGGRMKSGDNNGSGQFTKFCHECGTKYPVQSAKFCCECGVRRMLM